VRQASFAHARSRRRGLAALAAAGTAGLVGIAGCGIQSTSLRIVGSAPTLQAADEIGSASGSSGANGYELYFFRDGRLTPVQRYTDQTLSPQLVLAELIKGPDSADLSEGFSSELPPSLTVSSYVARDQEWNYQYPQALSTAEKAEIVCTVQVDLNAPSVGTVTPDQGEVWNNCSDFIEDYGAPAVLPTTAGQPTGVLDSGEATQ